MKQFKSYIFAKEKWEAVMAEHMHTKHGYPMATKFEFSYKDYNIKIEVELEKENT